MKQIKQYYNLAKPGIIYGNLLSALAGFFLASKFSLHIILLVSSMIGIALIIGSACVVNNVIDHNIDKKMERTKQRSIVNGDITSIHAIIFACVLGIMGFVLLFVYTNKLTVLIGFIGFVDYVLVYSLAKRTTIWSTLIGSISGAAPILAGYTAVTGRIDIAAVLLFLLMAFWQMPHFYGISLYRLQDYTNAGLLLWPIKKGVQSTKIQMIFYILAFCFSAILLTIFHYKGYIFLVVVILLSIIWIWKWVKGISTNDTTQWGKGMFLFSLVVLLITCIAIAIPWF